MKLVLAGGMNYAGSDLNFLPRVWGKRQRRGEKMKRRMVREAILGKFGWEVCEEVIFVEQVHYSD